MHLKHDIQWAANWYQHVIILNSFGCRGDNIAMELQTFIDAKVLLAQL